jgi:hypothetical protein
MRLKNACSGLKFLAVINRKRLIAVCAMVLAMTAGVVSQAASQTAPRANRITQELSGGPNVAIAGTVHPLTRRATDLGAVDSEMLLESMTLNIGLSAAQQTELDGLITAQQDPKSPQYHQWLTQEEYGARFGLTDADLGKVTGWLTGQGFSVKRISKSRNAIYFGGKAWRLESAFHTQLHQYELDGETHFANATELRIPAAIANVVLNVRGLNNFRLKPHPQRVVAHPQYTNGTADHLLTPGDWATIYDVNPIYGAGYDGTGAHVGVVGQTYVPQADIDNFRSAAGLSATKLTYVCIDTTVANCTGPAAISTVKAGDLGEADLDIEWAGGVAKNATVDYVYAPYSDTLLPANNPNGLDVFSALQYAVEDYTVRSTGQVLPVISMSYSDCEQSFVGNPSYVAFVTQVGQQANGQGQTIVVASGDSGAAGCDLQSDAADVPALYGAWVGIPADSPSYTGVGGTTLSGDEPNNYAAYWIQTPGLVNSALGYIPEKPWNETDSSGLAASGGGVSLFFSPPSWQPTLSGFSGAAMRLVPDVAFAAAVGHDGYMTCSQDDDSTTYGNSCTSGFASSKDYFNLAGGTSAATPSFAGMLTLLTQSYGLLGNINPMLYNLARNAATYATVFHDITTGDNVVPCVAGTQGCVSLEMGWSAATGYDLATGLGSIDGGALLNALSNASSIGASSTNTAVTAAPNALLMGGSTMLGVTVSPSSATGRVTFLIGGKPLGTISVSSGVATLSRVAVTTANGFTSGTTNTITATYSGDSTYASSTGTTTVTFPVYTLTETAPATIAAGSTGTVALTVTPSNYTGQVLLVASSSSANVTVSLSQSSVSLASGAAQSITLTISPSASAEKRAPTVPWKSGGAVMFCAVLMGAPIRRKRLIAVLLTALTILLGGILMSCGGGGGSASPAAAKAARTYTVMVTATGSGTVTNPPATTVIVTVP